MKYNLGGEVYTIMSKNDGLTYIKGKVVEIRLLPKEILYKVDFGGTSELREYQDKELFESVPVLKDWLLKEENKDHEEKVNSIDKIQEYR